MSVRSITAQSLVELFIIFSGGAECPCRSWAKPPNEYKNWCVQNKAPHHCGLALLFCQKQYIYLWQKLKNQTLRRNRRGQKHSHSPFREAKNGLRQCDGAQAGVSLISLFFQEWFLKVWLNFKNCWLSTTCSSSCCCPNSRRLKKWSAKGVCLWPLALKYSSASATRRCCAAHVLSMSWRLGSQEETRHRTVMWRERQSRMGTAWVVGWERAGSSLCRAVDPTFPTHTQWVGSKWALVLGQRDPHRAADNACCELLECLVSQLKFLLVYDDHKATFTLHTTTNKSFHGHYVAQYIQLMKSIQQAF